MAVYRVKFQVEVVEEIEADSREEAEDIFSEMWDGPEDIVEQGRYVVRKIG